MIKFITSERVMFTLDWVFECEILPDPTQPDRYA